MTQQITNFADTFLGTGISDSDMSISLTDGSKFPSRFFHVVLEPDSIPNREIVLIESRSGNTLTVAQRGVLGTTAIAHLAGVRVICTPLSVNFPSHVNKQTVNNPNIPALRAGSDEFDDELLHPDWLIVKRDTNTSILQFNEGNDVLSAFHNGLDNGGEMLGIVRPINGLTPPITIETAARCMAQYATNHLMWGLVFSTTNVYGSGSQMKSMPYIDTNTAGFRRSARAGANWISTTSYGTDNIQLVSPLYQRIRWNGGGSWEFFWSSDGVSWIRYPDNVVTNNFTPLYFGLWLSHWGGNLTSISTWEYFRVY